jgi:hypothetical protein
MPTTNKRISLVTDTEEITAVKAPPPSLILESKMVALDQPIPSDAAITESTAKPPPVATSAASLLSPSTRATVRVPLQTLAGLRVTPPGASPAAPGPAVAAIAAPPAARKAPLPRAPLVPFPPHRVVDQAPVSRSQTSGPFLTPRLASNRASNPSSNLPSNLPSSRSSHRSSNSSSTSAFPAKAAPRLSPQREALADIDIADVWTTLPSRTGLTLALAGLLIAGGVFAGWRLWWSVRPGHIALTTVPADAVIAVGGRALDGRAPMTVEEPPGSYTVSVTREGYARSDRTVDVQAGQQVVLAIELASLAGGLGPAAVVDGVVGPPGAHTTGATAAGARRASAGGAATSPGARPGPARPVAKLDAPTAVRVMPSILEGDEPPARATEPTPPPNPSAPSAEPVIAAAAPTVSPPSGEPPTLAARLESPPGATNSGPASGSSGGSSARTIAGRVAKAQLAIDPNADEYRVKLPPSLARAEMKLSAVVKLCVSAEGKVSDVKLLKPADPAVDTQIPLVLSRWRYRPLLTDGRPTPFCYVLQYEIAAP